MVLWLARGDLVGEIKSEIKTHKIRHYKQNTRNMQQNITNRKKGKDRMLGKL